jgi:hypothetical protein
LGWKKSLIVNRWQQKRCRSRHFCHIHKKNSKRKQSDKPQSIFLKLSFGEGHREHFVNKVSVCEHFVGPSVTLRSETLHIYSPAVRPPTVSWGEVIKAEEISLKLTFLVFCKENLTSLWELWTSLPTHVRKTKSYSVFRNFIGLM